MLKTLSPDSIRAYDIRADYRFLRHLVAKEKEYSCGDYRFRIIYDEIHITLGDSTFILPSGATLVRIVHGCNDLTVCNFEDTRIPLKIYVMDMMHTYDFDNKSDADVAAMILTLYDDFMTPLLTSLRVCMTVMR